MVAASVVLQARVYVGWSLNQGRIYSERLPPGLLTMLFKHLNKNNTDKSQLKISN